MGDSGLRVEGFIGLYRLHSAFWRFSRALDDFVLCL